MSSRPVLVLLVLTATLALATHTLAAPLAEVWGQHSYQDSVGYYNHAGYQHTPEYQRSEAYQGNPGYPDPVRYQDYTGYQGPGYQGPGYQGPGYQGPSHYNSLSESQVSSAYQNPTEYQPQNYHGPSASIGPGNYLFGKELGVVQGIPNGAPFAPHADTQHNHLTSFTSTLANPRTVAPVTASNDMDSWPSVTQETVYPFGPSAGPRSGPFGPRAGSFGSTFGHSGPQSGQVDIPNEHFDLLLDFLHSPYMRDFASSLSPMVPHANNDIRSLSMDHFSPFPAMNPLLDSMYPTNTPLPMFMNNRPPMPTFVPFPSSSPPIPYSPFPMPSPSAIFSLHPSHFPFFEGPFNSFSPYFPATFDHPAFVPPMYFNYPDTPIPNIPLPYSFSQVQFSDNTPFPYLHKFPIHIPMNIPQPTTISTNPFAGNIPTETSPSSLTPSTPTNLIRFYHDNDAFDYDQSLDESNNKYINDYDGIVTVEDFSVDDDIYHAELQVNGENEKEHEVNTTDGEDINGDIEIADDNNDHNNHKQEEDHDTDHNDYNNEGENEHKLDEDNAGEQIEVNDNENKETNKHEGKSADITENWRERSTFNEDNNILDQQHPVLPVAMAH